ncbi:hypothetical protein ABT160_05405 [Streptomyces sp. NPDC001941]|uniref:hypothetical protein n=1 Tax=Streptomyces sp. NPDC001941 TaxID=3154659 RepID=UPI0033172C1D
MRRSLVWCASALACAGVLAGPVTTAAAHTAGPEAAVRVAAAGTPATDPLADPPPPDAGTEREMRRQAKGFYTFGKMGAANAETSNFAGDVFNGQMDQVKLEVGLKKVDASLDNLLAIIPGGPPAHRSTSPILAATIDAIKKEVRKLADARSRNDYGALIASGAALTTQMSLLSAQMFTGFGIDIARQVLDAVFQPAAPPK